MPNVDKAKLVAFLEKEIELAACKEPQAARCKDYDDAMKYDQQQTIFNGLVGLIKNGEFDKEEEAMAIMREPRLFPPCGRVITTAPLIKKLEQYVEGSILTMQKVNKHNKLSKHDSEMIRQRIEQAEALLKKEI